MRTAVVFLPLFARVASACSCFSSPECDWLGSNSSPASRGNVLSVSDLPQTGPLLTSRVARFRVEESFGGLTPETREVEVLTGSSGRGGCGIPFLPGEQYLVHATVMESDGRLYTGLCNRTRHVDGAVAGLRVLRQRLARQPIPSLAGQIAQRSRDFKDRFSTHPSQPLGGILIRLQMRGKAFETRSDSDGFYAFYDLPAGRYAFEPDLPPGGKFSSWLDSDETPRPVEVTSGGCRERDLDIFPSGSIQGRVIDAETNRLIADSAVYLVPAGDAPLLPSERLHRESQRKQSYRFIHVPPGSYRVIVNPNNYRDPDFPYARTSYPVTIRAGEQVTGADLRLQPLFVPRRVQVRITWADGRVVGDLVHIDAQAVKGPEILAQIQYPRTKKNAFDVKLVPGESYIFTGKLTCRYSDARSSGLGARFESSPVPFTADDTRTELTLTLPVNACPVIPGKTLENEQP